MLRVGVTGGIGSGKSIVCQVFSTLGIPVFNADETARHLMENDPVLVTSLKKLLGENIYAGGRLDRARMSAIIFQEPGKLQQVNALVHPATITYGKNWFNTLTVPYAIKEAAIFFESGSYKDIDVMIGVYAPLELRIQRAMSRGNITREKVLSIISNQMNEDEKMKLCNFVITNDDITAVLPQVLNVHSLLLNGTLSPALSEKSGDGL